MNLDAKIIENQKFPYNPNLRQPHPPNTQKTWANDTNNK